MVDFYRIQIDGKAGGVEEGGLSSLSDLGNSVSLKSIIRCLC